MVLIHPYVPPVKELEERAKYMKVVKNRESGENLANDAFKATVVDNPLQLVTQFVTSANYDKYQIHLRDRILVAHAVSYEGILHDWQTLEEKVNYMEIANSNHPNKVQAILDLLTALRKDQKGFGLDFGKQVYDTVTRLSLKPDDDKKRVEAGPAAASTTALPSKSLKVESDDDYQGDTETVPKQKKNLGPITPARVVEEIFENERKSLLGVFTKKNLLYTDKSGSWSTRDLVPKTKDQIELPPNWKWVTEWEVETDENIDEDDGWRYAIDFNTSWSLKPTKTTFVRRRRWTRERVSMDTAEPVSPASEETDPLPQESSKGTVDAEHPAKETLAFYGLFVAPLKKLTVDIFTPKKDGADQATSQTPAAEKPPVAEPSDSSKQPTVTARTSTPPPEEKGREVRRRKVSKHKRVQSQQLLPLLTVGSGNLVSSPSSSSGLSSSSSSTTPTELSKRPSSEAEEYTSHAVDVAPRDVVPVSHTIGLWSLIALVALINFVFIVANAWMLVGLGGQIEAIKLKI